MACVAAVLVLVVVVAVVVLAAKGGDGAGDQFERAATRFHDVYTPTSKDLNEKLSLSGGGGFGDESYFAVTTQARKLSDAFEAYGTALGAIEFPADAKPAADKLGQSIEAGKVLMVNAAAFFSTAPIQAILDEYASQIETAVAADETSLRAALD
jgi:hypothetical protein